MNATAAIIPLCRHLKTNGRQCQSPALRGGPLCFFHAKLQDAHRRPPVVEPLYSGWQEQAIEMEGDPEGDLLTMNRVYPKQDEIQFPPLEDAESVQLATSMLFQAIAAGQIYFKRAKLLLDTLKIASINQRALANARAADCDKPVPTRIVCTTHGQFLAPPEEPTENITSTNTVDPAADTDPEKTVGPEEKAYPAEAVDHAAVSSATAESSATEYPGITEVSTIAKDSSSAEESRVTEESRCKVSRDFSPGTTAAESAWALAPGVCPSRLLHPEPTRTAAYARA